MANELFNEGQVTPARLHAMLRLVARQPGLSRGALIDLVQPSAVTNSQNAAEVVLTAAVGLGLIDAEPGRGKPVRLAVAPEDVEEFAAYRRTMADRVLGVTDDDAANHLFNLFTAWYAALDAEVLGEQAAATNTIVIDFNARVFAHAEGQQVNETKFAAWRPWASFFGFGWELVRGQRSYIVPDARERLDDVLDGIVGDAKGPIPFRQFRQRLANSCPELDGGQLFERVIRFRRGNERGQTVSLMLSTALRSLHEAGRCELLELADAGDTWTLYPATGERFSTVTHVAPGKVRHA